MTLKARSSFALSIRKPTRGGYIAVTKNFVIPRSEFEAISGSNEFTIKQTIAMLSQSEANLAGQTNEIAANQDSKQADKQITPVIAEPQVSQLSLQVATAGLALTSTHLALQIANGMFWLQRYDRNCESFCKIRA